MPLGRARPKRAAVLAAAGVLVMSLMGVGLPGAALQQASVVTGSVTNLGGVPLADVSITLGDRALTTGQDGRFRFDAPAPATMTFTRVGYAPASFEWNGDDVWLDVVMTPRLVRGIHVSGVKPASDAGFAEMTAIARSTAVNSLMIDIKNESGLVFHQTAVPTVAEVGSAYAEAWDLATRVEEAHALGLYVIVRIVTFEDPIAARARPAWAVRNADGSLLVHSGQYWLDPTDASAQQYALDLAAEACEMGVDEVQFDYVRFPTGDKSTMRFDGSATATGRQAAITEFLERARSQLAPMGCATAADIFGFITHVTHEGGIGQQLEALAETIDVISPMIYPSHYVSGWYGYAVPNDHPGAIVRNASQDALDRLTTSQAVLRPWLQDFWYTAAQVETQIVTIDSLDLGWLLWNISSDFTVAGIPADGALDASDAAPPPAATDRPDSGFFDVSDANLHAAAVSWAYAAGVTNGCDAPWGDLFCPAASVTRGQMAAFLVRAFDLPAVAATSTFTDDDASRFEAEIEAVAAAGLTLGCEPGLFCPDDDVTRAQVASFLARALDLAITETTNRFGDVEGIHTGAIEALSRAGVTNGCTTTRYCPDASLRRDHLVTFLFRSVGV